MYKMGESKLIKSMQIARSRGEFIQLVNKYFIPFHLVRHGKLDVSGNSLLELKLKGTQFTTVDESIRILTVCILRES